MGKGTVARIFCAHGAAHIDADAVYRQLLETSGMLLEALCAEFGAVCTPDGRLDRPKLASIVFSDANKLARLNEIGRAHV